MADERGKKPRASGPAESAGGAGRLGPRPEQGGRRTRVLLAVTVVGLMVVIFAVVSSMRGGGDDGQRSFFDPTTTDPGELRRVTEAVSRVIAAPADQHVQAVETLESVRAESAGARDLKDACVNTYRGLIRAQEMMRELEQIEGAPDGGVRSASEISPQDRIRATDLHTRATEQVELITQSRDRCMDLYLVAVRRLGLTPAQRPTH